MEFEEQLITILYLSYSSAGSANSISIIGEQCTRLPYNAVPLSDERHISSIERCKDQIEVALQFGFI